MIFCRHCNTNKKEEQYNKSTSRCNNCESKRKLKYKDTPKIDVTEKECFTCKKTKSLGDFHNDRRTPTGKTSSCKECASERMKRWYWDASSARKQSIKEGTLRRSFGISLDEYYRMLEDQKGFCVICGNKDKTRYLAVDHNHETGEIRGLLCSQCNTGLGCFKDNLQLLTNAYDYLSYKET